jgi:hypothetical protein
LLQANWWVRWWRWGIVMWNLATPMSDESLRDVKTELFHKDSVPELSSKKMGNSPSFLTITRTTLSAKWFRCYGILTIDVAAEFCFWTEQWQNRSSIPSLGLAETPDISNTISVEKSLSFPMVH